MLQSAKRNVAQLVDTNLVQSTLLPHSYNYSLDSQALITPINMGCTEEKSNPPPLWLPVEPLVADDGKTDSAIDVTIGVMVAVRDNHVTSYI